MMLKIPQKYRFLSTLARLFWGRETSRQLFFFCCFEPSRGSQAELIMPNFPYCCIRCSFFFSR